MPNVYRHNCYLGKMEDSRNHIQRVQCTYKDCSIRGLLNPRVVELEGCWIRGSLNRRFVESEDCSIQGLFNLRIVKSKGCSIQGLLNPRVVETVLLNSSLCNPWLAAVEVAPPKYGGSVLKTELALGTPKETTLFYDEKWLRPPSCFLVLKGVFF